MPSPTPAQVSAALAALYGVTGTLRRIPEGTATDNYALSGARGARFVKVYRDSATLSDEQRAIRLARFAAAGGLPVPRVHRTTAGDHLGVSAGVALSLWDHIENAETAEGRLHGGRWEAVGLTLGRLHRRLATHPGAVPAQRPGATLRDVTAVRDRFEALIAAYRALAHRDEDQEWALASAEQRRALLPRVAGLLAGLPGLGVQVLHGDLSSPNLLLRGGAVAALVDFQPPRPNFTAWEVTRIGCDPETLLRHADWPDGLARLLDAHAQEYPAGALDLRTAMAVGCVVALTSSYPLEEPLRPPDAGRARLMRYAHARHRAGLLLLDALA